VSHLVTYDAENGPVFRTVAELGEAIALVEQLRNDVGLERARIYRLEEVAFEFRPYFRVAIAEGPATGWGDPFAAAYPPAVADAEMAVVAADAEPDVGESTEATPVVVSEAEATAEPLVEPTAVAGVQVLSYDEPDEEEIEDVAVLWRETDASPGVDAGVWAAVAGQAANGGVRPAEEMGTLPPPPSSAAIRRNIFGR
jgi:hypothetical protein